MSSKLKALCWVSLVWLIYTGCGEPTSGVLETPESCLINQSAAQDCVIEPFHQEEFDLRVLFESREDLEIGCEQMCSKSTRSFDFQRLEGLVSLEGFGFIDELPGLGVKFTHDLITFDAFDNVETMVGVSVFENPHLEVMETLDSLTHLEHGANFEDNPKLVDLRALANVRQIGEIGGRHSPGLKLRNNMSLTSMAGLASVEVIGGQLLLADQHNIESMEGLESLQEVEYFVILNAEYPDDRVKLNSLAGLENLRRIHKALTIENAPNLRRCEAEALIAQLDEPPEVVNLVNLSDEPCD